MNSKYVKQSKIRVSDGNRIAKLASMGEDVFTTNDLATIWSFKNRTSLRVTLARYVKRGLLHRIWKGVYSISKLKTIDPNILGLKILHRYAYISCETVLFDAGILNQRPTEITIVSDVSKRFSVLGNVYRSRKMQDALLYDSTGISMKGGIRIATPERAKQDMMYFNPNKYYDANL